MLRLAYGLLLAFCAAVLVHIAIVFLIPRLDLPETTKQIQALSQSSDPVILKGDDTNAPVTGVDPFFRYRVCEFNLDNGNFLLTSVGDAPFFSATLVGENGNVLFSITDRQTIDRKLNIEVSPISVQQALSQNNDEANATSDVVPVFVSVSKGYAIVRAFVPDSSWSEITDTFLNDIDCEAVEAEN